jgi:hypothetical protein
MEDGSPPANEPPPADEYPPDEGWDEDLTWSSTDSSTPTSTGIKVRSPSQEGNTGRNPYNCVSFQRVFNRGFWPRMVQTRLCPLRSCTSAHQSTAGSDKS